MGLEEFKKNPLCKYQLTDADEDLVAEALENPKNVKELYMAIGIEGVSYFRFCRLKKQCRYLLHIFL